MKTWRLACISATGFAKKRHMPSYKRMENVEVVAAVDMNEAALNATCDEFGIAGRYTSVDEMLEKERPDIASVVVQPRSHIPLSRKCVEAGCNVLVEKPLSEDYGEIVEFLDFLKGRREKVMVSQNYRFQNPALEMKDVITSGRLGEVYWAEGTVYVSSGPEPKESPKYKGLFVNIGIHVVDLMRYFVDREVEAVHAPRLASPHTKALRYPFSEITIHFEGGATALARMDWTSLGHERWITNRVQGTEAVALCDYPEGPDILIQRQGGPVERSHREEECDDIQKALAHLIDCVEKDRQPSTWVGDNIKTMEVMLAAYLSCRDGRVVHFPADRERLREI